MNGSGRPWLGWDWPLFFSAATLTLLSALAVASASATLNPHLAFRHSVWILLGACVACGVAQTNYLRWIGWAGLVYGAGLCALGLVPLMGSMRLGATRWLSLFGLSVQPSELAKLATIVLLARLLAGQPAPLPSRAILLSLGLSGVPAVAVLVQPDLGTATVFGAIWLGLVWVAGMSRRSLGVVAGCLLLAVPMGWHVLKDYQRDRLAVFINPQADPLGAGFSIIQSTIAIGSGGLWGKGWFAGTQNQLSFLPERHADFLFSVIGEEWGLLGCLAVVGMTGLLLARILRIARQAAEPQGKLVAVGVSAWIGYQAVVNMGMVMGLLPVVGVPLPFVSYGGTAMITAWGAVGLLQSIHRHEVAR